MALTLFAARALIAPLNLLCGFGRGRAPRELTRGPSPFQAAPVRAGAARAALLPAAHRPPGPVRVVRVAEPWCAPSGAGRMVISGRMADVCAELDRLAALETRAARR